MVPTFNLPQELINHIFEFCIDKKLNWDKLIQQYLKGGFNRTNLRLDQYLKKEHWCAKKFWMSKRPEISGQFTQWNSVTKKREQCLYSFPYGGWNIKFKGATVIFKTQYGQRIKSSAKNPVSVWLKNIKKFESVHHELAKKMYLRNTPSPIKVKGVSKFYVNLRAKNKKRRKKEKFKERASLFMEERRQLKLDKCKFKKNQEVLLSFIMSSGKLKFYKGSIRNIYFHRHRDDRFRFIFPAPKGPEERFDSLKVDNYIGEVKIVIRFEDGEYRDYSSERLRQRIETSAKEKYEQENTKKLASSEHENIELVDEDDNSYLCKKMVIDNIKYFIMPEFESLKVQMQNMDIEEGLILLNIQGDLAGIYNKTTDNIIEAEWED